MPNQFIGPRIRQERERRKMRESGWRLLDVAEKIGVKRSQNYANYEYGLREPDADMISKLAKLYDVTSDYLIGLSNNPKLTHADLMASFELSDKEILDMYEFMVDGKPVTSDEQSNMIAFIRAKRMTNV